MQRILLCLLGSLLLVGCGPRYVDYFPYHDDGTPKPRIALVPVVNAADCCLPWDIGQELTNAIRFQAMQNGELFLLSENEVQAYTSRCCNADYFGCDISFAKQFCNADYVVVLEIIEHGLVPYRRGCGISPCYPAQSLRCNSVLQSKVRVRIIDVRCECPKIVLQEIFTSNFLVPPEGECLDYTRHCWGSKSFPSTPYGQAHKKLVRDLVCRIESSIW